jgi:hypothetical protein
MKILFLHGLESRPGGTKVQYLQGLGHDVLNPLLPKADFEESVRVAQEYIDNEGPSIIVGSSRGAAVAMSTDTKGARMILIAPAWRKFDIFPTAPKGTIILHCETDTIVPYEDSTEFDNNVISCGTNHRMQDEDALKALGQAVGGN